MISTDIQYPIHIPSHGPSHFNQQFKNQTTHWSGTDKEELFIKNCNDAIQFEILKRLGWYNSVIVYQRNSHGFRCEEFDSRPAGIAVGCSYTEGIGLPLEHTWPYILSQKLGCHIWNLGVQGSGIDTAFRVAEFYIEKLKPQFVCLLLPPPFRFEYCDIRNGFPTLSSHNASEYPFMKDWLAQPFNGIYNLKKTLYAFERLCDLAGIPLAVNDSQEDNLVMKPDLDLARDLMHKGIKYQTHQADRLYNDLIEKRKHYE